jgi:hypothetical protein
MTDEVREVRAYEVVLVTGERLRTTKEYTTMGFYALINRSSNSIECKTLEAHEADRRLWMVRAAHVAKFRRLKP